MRGAEADWMAGDLSDRRRSAAYVGWGSLITFCADKTGVKYAKTVAFSGELCLVGDG